MLIPCKLIFFIFTTQMKIGKKDNYQQNVVLNAKNNN